MNEPPVAEAFLLPGGMKTPRLNSSETNDVNEVTRLLLVLFKRFISKLSSANHPSHTPEQTVMRIKEGDEQARSEFIARYEPYLLKVTSGFCKRYVNPEQDDEYSVALLAFNEAIDSYSPNAGRSFLGFAETVIRRRLIDYVRKEQRHSQSVPYSSFDREDEDQTIVNPIETSQALDQHDREREKDDRKHEIIEFSARLKLLGISFSDLADQAPKHADTRRMLFQIGRMAAEQARFYDAIVEKGRLPVTELAEEAGVSRKTIERNRKYIIALALLYRGDYPYIRAYITQTPEQANYSSAAREVEL